MNSRKLETYNLSPDEYLQKFKNPKQVISERGNSEQDEKDRVIIEDILSKFYNDTAQLRQLKTKIISELRDIINRWMGQVALATKNELLDWEAAGFGIKVFGSFRLKTNSYDGDIDILCVVPEYFSREQHFFRQLAAEFRKEEHFKEIFSIPDAIVPLMRLSISGVQIDLLLARIRETFLRDNPLFFEGGTESQSAVPIQERQIRSINGYRTAVYLNTNYVEKYRNFRETLKAVKMWAKNKGIYSQIYGYLGGAAISIMLAKICQLYPNYSCLQLLDRFFFIYAHWVWTIPVLIETVEFLERPDSEMVILTPLEPHMNAGHYVTKATSNITKQQLRLASKCIQDINKGKRTWHDLFRPMDFFSEYRNFLEISVMGQKIDDFIPWRGSVESKIRKLVQYLEEQSDFAHGIEINPYPRQFHSKHPSFKHCSRYYIGIRCSSNSSVNDYYEIDFTQSVKSFIELLEKYPQIQKIPLQINVGFMHLTRKQVPGEVIEQFNRFMAPK